MQNKKKVYLIISIVSFSIVLAALASATAPASTMMTIRQTKAKGDFVDTLQNRCACRTHHPGDGGCGRDSARRDGAAPAHRGNSHQL